MNPALNQHSPAYQSIDADGLISLLNQDITAAELTQYLQYSLKSMEQRFSDEVPYR
jgi:hypothetical protein